MKRHPFALIALAAIGVALLFGSGWMLLSKRGNGSPDPRQVAAGETIYRERCAQCHGANLEGQPNWQRRKPDGRLPAPPHDATGHTWHHPDAQLFALTKDGLAPPIAPEGYQSDMPAFGGTLSDEQIWAVLAYIKSRWPQDIQQRQQQIDQASRKQRPAIGASERRRRASRLATRMLDPLLQQLRATLHVALRSLAYIERV